MSTRARIKARQMVRRAIRNMQDGDSMLMEQAKIQQRKAYNDTIANVRDELRKAVNLFDDAIDMATDNANKWGEDSEMHEEFLSVRDRLLDYKEHLAKMVDEGWVKDMMDEVTLANEMEAEIAGGI